MATQSGGKSAGGTRKGVANAGKPSQKQKTEDSEVPSSQNRSILTKTRFCIFFARNQCTKGTKCTFAHDVSDLRTYHDLSCTKICPSVHSGKKCTNPSCRYAHRYAELRVIMPGGQLVEEVSTPTMSLASARNYPNGRVQTSTLDLTGGAAPHPPRMARPGQIRAVHPQVHDETKWQTSYSRWLRERAKQQEKSGSPGQEASIDAYESQPPRSRGARAMQPTARTNTPSRSYDSSGESELFNYADVPGLPPGEFKQTVDDMQMHPQYQDPFPLDHAFVEFVSGRIDSTWAMQRNTSTSIAIWDPSTQGIMVGCCERFPDLMGSSREMHIGTAWNFFQNGFTKFEEENETGMKNVLKGEQKSFACIQTGLRGAMQKCRLLLQMFNVDVPTPNGRQRYVFSVQADITEVFLTSHDLSELDLVSKFFVEGALKLFHV